MKPKAANFWITLFENGLYASTIIAVEMSREFNLVGSQRIKEYDKWDWMILLISIWALVGINVKTYFDNSHHQRKDEAKKNGNGSGHTDIITK